VSSLHRARGYSGRPQVHLGRARRVSLGSVTRRPIYEVRERPRQEIAVLIGSFQIAQLTDDLEAERADANRLVHELRPAA
jgi:hypothetical protein